MNFTRHDLISKTCSKKGLLPLCFMSSFSCFLHNCGMKSTEVIVTRHRWNNKQASLKDRQTNIHCGAIRTRQSVLGSKLQLQGSIMLLKSA